MSASGEVSVFPSETKLRFSDESIAGPWRVMSNDGRTLVTLHPGGRIEFDPTNLEEGARIFWEAVAGRLALHETACPECGTTIRARMADG